MHLTWTGNNLTFSLIAVGFLPGTSKTKKKKIEIYRLRTMKRELIKMMSHILAMLLLENTETIWVVSDRIQLTL